jgi:hypothetical protein
VDKAQLIAAAAAALPTEEVEIPGVGTVTVRGLSRGESLLVGKAEGDPTATERTMLRFGMVDPVMTDADIRDWLKVAPNAHVDPISRKIAELSGMLEDAPKAAFQGDGGGPDA